VLELCRSNRIPAYERDFTIEEVSTADEAFVTGTFAGLTPVVEFDGKPVGEGHRGPMCERLQDLYVGLVRSECGG
jgi:branched-chain amino acid aminotransferase